VDSQILNDSDKAREDRARRAIARLGCTLRKSRRRNPVEPEFGRFCIIDAQSNWYIAGGIPYAYSMSLDDLESWLER